MKNYQRIAMILSLTLTLLGCGASGGVDDISKLPVAADDTATVSATQKKLTIIPILDNDKPRGELDAGSVTVTSPPKYGTLNIKPTGEVEYTPTSSPLRDDAFVYTLKDKQGNFSNPATVTITVVASPIAGDDSLSGTRGKPLIFKTTDLFFNDSNNIVPDSFTIITPPSHGTIQSLGGTARQYVTNDPNYYGIDTYTYTLSDANGNVSNTATVTISILQKPFKITVKTDNPGISNNNEFTIPIVGGSYDIDCGGSTNNKGTAISGKYTCIYSAAGTYTINITGDIPQLSFFTDTGVTKDNLKLLSIDQWGTGLWGTMDDTFRYCSNMTSTTRDTPNLSNTTSMRNMFANASKFNGNIENWDVSTIKDMSGMFSNAIVFNKNIGNWKVDNVTNMSWMFNQASSFNQDISNWKVDNVTSMRGMFNLASAFNQDISQWKVNNVTNMSWMFRYATKFNQDISGWIVDNVTDMSSMFSQASVFNQNIRGWNVDRVIDMNNMFNNAITFNQDISKWHVGAVTDMHRMFWKANAFNQDISSWDVSSVTDMNDMLRSAISFTNQDLSGWIVSKVTTHNNFLTGAGLKNTEPNWP